jgi:hypothetical protein
MHEGCMGSYEEDQDQSDMTSGSSFDTENDIPITRRGFTGRMGMMM